MTLEQLITSAAKLKTENDELRYGQALMNALHKLNPELYNTINGTDVDPFHGDDRIGKFYTVIAELIA